LICLYVGIAPSFPVHVNCDF
ncbi:hypothetical protein BAE44_0007007, partial [Dichanthelium oligosanthes]